jgi:hypothetical protein
MIISINSIIFFLPLKRNLYAFIRKIDRREVVGCNGVTEILHDFPQFVFERRYTVKICMLE